MIQIEEIIGENHIAKLNPEQTKEAEAFTVAIHRVCGSAFLKALEHQSNPILAVHTMVMGMTTAFQMAGDKAMSQYMIAYFAKVKQCDSDLRKTMEFLKSEGLPLSQAVLGPETADDDCDCATCEGLRKLPKFTCEEVKPDGDNVLDATALFKAGKRPTVSQWGKA